MHGASPISVTAVAQTDKPDIYPRVDDDATIIIRYPKMQAVLMPSWNWPFNRKDMEVYGTKGYAFADDPTHMRTRFVGRRSEEQASVADPVPAPYDTSLHYVAAVVRGEIHPQGDLTALDTNVVVVQILDAARRSVQTGRTITLPPLPQ
jgi:predicted dehydrogenase